VPDPRLPGHDGISAGVESRGSISEVKQIAKAIAEAARKAAEVAENARKEAAAAAEKAAKAVSEGAKAAGEAVKKVATTYVKVTMEVGSAVGQAAVSTGNAVKQAAQATNKWAQKNLLEKDFWKCFGGVMGDNAAGLAAGWALGAAGGPVGLGFAAAATGAAIGGAAGSCWNDHKQDRTECLVTNGSILVVGAAGMGYSIGTAAYKLAYGSVAKGFQSLGVGVAEGGNNGSGIRSVVGC